MVSVYWMNFAIPVYEPTATAETVQQAKTAEMGSIPTRQHSATVLLRHAPRFLVIHTWVILLSAQSRYCLWQISLVL